MCSKYRKDESAVFKKCPLQQRERDRERRGGGGRKNKDRERDRETYRQTETETEQTQPCNETVEKLLEWIFIEPC